MTRAMAELWCLLSTGREVQDGRYEWLAWSDANSSIDTCCVPDWQLRWKYGMWNNYGAANGMMAWSNDKYSAQFGMNKQNS